MPSEEGNVLEKNIVSVFPVSIPMESLLSDLRLEPDDDSFETVSAMREAAVAIAKPVALCAPFTPESTKGMIRINGVLLEEPFIHTMLSGCGTVVPYAATCGRAIDTWARSFTDMFEQFIADTIKQRCLRAVMDALFDAAREQYFNAEQPLSTLNPGSLTEWPLAGQRPLFAILGGITDDTGIVLSDSLLMSPNKSVSGIMFQADEAFHNCQLCPRTDCSGRRVPYAGG